jgi:hypothetical protein
MLNLNVMKAINLMWIGVEVYVSIMNSSDPSKCSAVHFTQKIGRSYKFDINLVLQKVSKIQIKYPLWE